MDMNVVNFTVIATIGLANMNRGQFPEGRIMNFETMAGALKCLLEHLGRPLYLSSIFQLWTGITNSLVLMETMHFPDQAPATNTALILPPRARPLSAILDHDFGQHIPLIAPATNCLEQFIAWHRQNYDEEELHRDTTTMLEDAFLILQSVHELLHLHPANATVPGPSADTGGPDGDMIAALEPLLFAP